MRKFLLQVLLLSSIGVVSLNAAITPTTAIVPIVFQLPSGGQNGYLNFHVKSEYYTNPFSLYIDPFQFSVTVHSTQMLHDANGWYADISLTYNNPAWQANYLYVYYHFTFDLT